MSSRILSAFAALAVTGCAGLAAPPVAGAATLNGAGTLTYTAAAGQQNNVDFSEIGANTVRVTNADLDAITPSGTCAATADPSEYACTAITRVAADGGDLADSLDATGLTTIPVGLSGSSGGDSLASGAANDTLAGGDGEDFLSGGDGRDTLSGGEGTNILGGEAGDDLIDGGSGSDTIDGGDGDDRMFSGAGNDILRGGRGSDSLTPGDGADDVSGGADFDTAFVTSISPTPDLSVTLDDQANDGTQQPVNEGKNIRSDVEDVSGFSAISTNGAPGIVTLVGSAGSNNLSVESGNASVDGGNGNDSLFGGPQNDTIIARDGFFDRVQCRGGEDTANVDTFDSVASDCEHINAVDVGNASEDKPPTVTFTAPAGDAAKVGTRSPTTLAATASDDKGVAKVQFLDDERIVCEDTTAPYTCDYMPRGGDVGRNTFSAVAIDTAQQTATARRTATVGRFVPRSVTLKVKPSRDASSPRRFTASGTVNLPAGVTAAEGCSGQVAIQVKAGKKIISNRRAKVSKSCRFKQRVTFKHGLPSSGVLKFTARYQGNAVLTTRKSKSKNVRTK